MYRSDDPDYVTDNGREFHYPHSQIGKAAILADHLLSFVALADCTLDAAGLRGLRDYCAGSAITFDDAIATTRSAFWKAAAAHLEAILAARLADDLTAAREAMDAAQDRESYTDEPTRAVITRADAGDEDAARELHARSDRDDLEAREWSEEHR